MAEKDLPIDNEKLSLIDRLTDFRVVLLLLTFALAADPVLIATLDHGLITVTWQELGARPGLMLLFLIGFGIMMSVCAPLLATLLMPLLQWPTLTLQAWLDFPINGNPNPYRFVSTTQAEERLANKPDDGVRQRLDTQREKRSRGIARWNTMVNCSAICFALIVYAWRIDGTWVHAIATWNLFAFCALIFVAAFPVGYHAWAGYPGHDWVEWPELARELARERAPAYLRRPSSYKLDDETET